MRSTTDKLLGATGTFFVFDLSPFMVKIDNDRMPLTHFLVKICAIIGGVVSVGLSCPVLASAAALRRCSRPPRCAQIAGFIDSFMYNSLHVRRGAAALTSKFG